MHQSEDRSRKQECEDRIAAKKRQQKRQKEAEEQLFTQPRIQREKQRMSSLRPVARHQRLNIAEDHRPPSVSQLCGDHAPKHGATADGDAKAS